MRRWKQIGFWLIAGCALLSMQSCGYAAGYGVRQLIDGPGMMMGEDFAPVPPGIDPGMGDMQSGEVGQRIEAENGVALTVRSAERTTELDGTQAGEGQTFVVLDVLIENGSEDALSGGMIPFSLETSGGDPFINAPVAGEEALPAGTLEPGEQAQGLIAFQQVDANTTDLSLIYEPMEFLAQGIPPIQVDLSMALPAVAAGDGGDGGVPAPDEGPVGQVGEPLNLSGVVLTVLSAERTDTFENNTAAAGNDLLVLEAQIENTSDESAQVQRFEIEDSQGNEWSARRVEQQGSKSFLGFGETIQLQIVSEIPEPLSGLQLTYVPFDDEENASTMRVALDDMAPVAGGQDQPGDGGTTAQEPPPDAPVGTVTNGGNMRSEPRIAPETVIAQVCPSDQVEFLEQQGGWYRIRVYATAADCVANRAAAGTEGWVSATLLSQPSAAVPADGAQPGGGGDGGGDGDGVVNNGGNFRSEPRIAPDTVLGQICPGDTVDILEQRQSGGTLWYQVRVTATAEDCHPERVSADTQGWLSSVLVTRR
jgi:hypothetical protein